MKRSLVMTKPTNRQTQTVVSDGVKSTCLEKVVIDETT